MCFIIWLSIIGLYILESMGRIVSGLVWLLYFFGLLVLGIGDIWDVFYVFGKMFWLMYLLIMLVSGEVMYFVISLIYLEGFILGFIV